MAALALHFILELCALAVFAVWGWSDGDHGLWQVGRAVLFPVAAASAWATFRVPGDPGDAPVPVPGLLRLALEIGLFGLAALLLVAMDQPVLAGLFAAAVVLDYVITHERVLRLLRG